MSSPNKIALFDLDGTLSPARKPTNPEMLDLLKKIRKVVSIGVVSGSDLKKIEEQLGANSGEVFDYTFAENGVMAYKGQELINSEDFASALGEELLQNLINFTLKYFSELKLPKKRGTFIEYRSSMLNLCPIGRNCTYAERLEFVKYDEEHGVRKKFIASLQEAFQGSNLQFALGGQISVDCFLKGRDKSYCLQFIDSLFDEIHFFGDRVFPGGNDYEIYIDPRTVGHSVSSPDDTSAILRKLFLEDE